MKEDGRDPRPAGGTDDDDAAARSRAWFQTACQTVFLALVLALTLAGSAAGPGHLPGALPSSTVGGTLWFFFGAFAATTFLVLLLLRLTRSAALLGTVFAVAVFMGVGTITSVLAGPSAAVLITAAAVFAYYGFRRVVVHDLILTGGLSGVAVIVGGGLRDVAAVVILAVLAVYDIVAVYGTKHMVTMGKELLRRGAAFAFVVPDGPAGLFRRIDGSGTDGRHMFLGTGDAVLPALLVAATARYDAAAAVYPALGAVVGLWVTLAIFFTRSGRRPMPALPPIALGAILGYVLTILQ